MARKDPSAPQKEKKEKKPKRERVKKPPPPPMPKPLLKSQQHAKWPAMFKRHLGMIETHIKLLDRMMTSMKADIDKLEPELRRQWLTGETGNWTVMVGLMKRARQTLVDARTAGSGIVCPLMFAKQRYLGCNNDILTIEIATTREAEGEEEPGHIWKYWREGGQAPTPRY